MALSEDDERRVEGQVLAMTRELRERPSQEKEDRIGVEIAIMPEEEREFVPTALLRLLVREREGRLDDLDPSPARRLPPRRRRGFFRRG
ncbi:MAG TPA: hypothetical protein VHA76_11605 [Solirubrobacterales bacterium]|nr:hypothetical protein [Solirubrobacterales bacterium]